MDRPDSIPDSMIMDHDLPVEIAEPITQAVVRSETLWFDDGNIVLQAENTRFCVHRGMLSVKSAVFKNMLALPGPQEGDTENRAKDRPLVHVSDTALEMEYLLDALYNLTELRDLELKFDTVGRLCAILRLSTKYIIPQLRKSVSVLFNNSYPSDLNEWDRLRILSGDTDIRLFYWEDEVVNVISEVQLLTPLPLLLYRETASLESIGEVYDRGFSDAITKHLVRGHDAFNTAMRRCIADTLQLSRWLYCVPESSHTQCEAGIRRICDDMIWNSAEVVCGDLQPLRMPGDLRYLDRNDRQIDRFCDKCLKEIKNRIPTQRAELWKKLPEMFGLNSWEYVREADAAYLASMASDE